METYIERSLALAAPPIPMSAAEVFSIQQYGNKEGNRRISMFGQVPTDKVVCIKTVSGNHGLFTDVANFVDNQKIKAERDQYPAVSYATCRQAHSSSSAHAAGTATHTPGTHLRQGRPPRHQMSQGRPPSSDPLSQRAKCSHTQLHLHHRQATTGAHQRTDCSPAQGKARMANRVGSLAHHPQPQRSLRRDEQLGYGQQLNQPTSVKWEMASSPSTNPYQRGPKVRQPQHHQHRRHAGPATTAKSPPLLHHYNRTGLPPSRDVSKKQPNWRMNASQLHKQHQPQRQPPPSRRVQLP